MKIAFISNYLNHHQLPFCIEMCKKTNNEFYFIATQTISKERLSLGYEDMNAKYPFVIETYKNNAEKQKALEYAKKCDIVIIGSAPDEYIEERLKENKITFRYSERIFKKEIWRIINPRIIRNLYINHTRYKDKNLYMLCASAYTAHDFSLANAYIDKCYKWGYFPETQKYDIEQLMNNKEKNSKIQLLWVARFIDWKHPELPIKLAKWLKKQNYDFELQMIGCGPLLEKIKNKVVKEKMTDCVKILGAIKSSDVRKYMENANIFLITSDQNEGWGAVVNEAMNSACVVIGNKKIGSIPFLIKDGKNGFTYSNQKEFFYRVKWIIENKEKQRIIGKNAYSTIIKTWNAENATHNLIELCNSLLENRENTIENGPCSKANIK